MLLLCYFECAPHCSAECDKRIFTGEGNHFPQNRQKLSLAGEPEKPSGFDGAGRSGEVLGGGHLGDLGAIVKVKDGYARNFLIPQGHAKRATKAAIEEFEARRAELERLQAERIAQAQETAEKLNGQVIEITSKAGVDGRLFGSVTNADIAEAVDKLGFQIKKSQVRTPLGAIKSVGDFTITIGLLTDITADIVVRVVAEAA